LTDVSAVDAFFADTKVDGESPSLPQFEIFARELD
jgi:hypothetical protein